MYSKVVYNISYHILINDKRVVSAAYLNSIWWKTMVKLSIIMPVFNASKFLNKSLKSILNQTFNDYELICVNDGSTDNSLKILESFAEDHDFLRVFSITNSGSGKARNYGMKEAKGEYLAFLDADDIFLDSHALERMIASAVKNDADMVGANLKRIKQDYTLEEDYDFENTLFAYFDKDDVIKASEYGIPWAFYKNIYKKSFVTENNISFPDLKRGQDPVFLANVLTRIERIYTVAVDLYGYNHSVSGGVNVKLNSYDKKRDYIQHFADTFKILDKECFELVLADYKMEFVNYLTFRQNLSDEDINMIVREVFEGDDVFEKEDYGYMILDLIYNPPEKVDDEYETIKEFLFEESMLEDNFIDLDRLNDFIEISEASNEDEERIKRSFNQLKEIDDYTFREKRSVYRRVGKLKHEINNFIHSNDSILNSNSWKVTSFLRSIKHKL